MSHVLTKSCVASLMFLASTASLPAGTRDCHVRAATPPVEAGSRVIYKVVQPTAAYSIERAEVTSGSTLTLFAPFLREEVGYVMFQLNGTSSQCPIMEWKGESVTAQLPHLGLNRPQNAQIQIVLPDGRIAKTFPVVLVPQPDILVHSNTIPQPMPPAPAAQSATYATPVSGGLVLQSGVE